MTGEMEIIKQPQTTKTTKTTKTTVTKSISNGKTTIFYFFYGRS